MRTINLSLGGQAGYEAAAKAAREAVGTQAGANFSLLAWFDKARKTGAPQEACSLENWKCVRDYADHHQASVKVSVNDDAFEFYFAKAPAGTATLDEDGVADVHKGIAVDKDENVQGG